jgi:sugar O-acyltransferase (sialic acid O-acetyltransferase NeuD family)
MIHTLRVPLLNANDEEVEVVDILTRDGAPVRAGDRLFVVESTKATVEVEAPVDGFVRRLAVERFQRVKVQALLCLISSTADEALPADEERRAANTGFRATRKAEELAAAHGIDLATLKVDGVIKEADVAAAIEKKARANVPARPWLVPPQNATPVVVLGGGGHARVLVDLMRLAGNLFPIGAVDDAPSCDEVLGVPVIGSSARLAEVRDAGFEHAALGIGSVRNHANRRAYWDKLVAAGFELPNLIHPRAMLEPSVKMGAGNQIFAGAVIGSAAVLGDNTIINSGTVVSHDCVIGSQTHISPGAILAGGVHVGENSLIGMGVTIYLGVKIGRDVVIANGSQNIKDVPDGTIVRASF